ncbi:MAG TPA: 2-amino-4-hydroxy-6-hydroxymethyldihydropteridine diphosphokinase [Deltaproteobacteria bacterium]|nr:2-amino-4-hydroxy-6-hydroxymethyldihydropteridine diphosphokinase [Deltaproteobacteria bacterium]HOM29340.1 2-amino-4-hydroxy-6-hydroxymethyldihydropteridine diphosphokinase [Deltaproteobacteria bacterium]HPP80324.1 2-amino-4-hydroxy-6-hydroxymethyldihydropteridine diphosphokinase [Deltaproteobacteria bacterium]
MIRGYLGIGSNEGDRALHLALAREELQARGVTIGRVSRVYETVPVEVPGPQRPYYNMVAEFTFRGGPLGLLDVCLEVERALGRRRPYKNAPRTVDIDILFIEGRRIKGPRLEVPHPRMEKRAFVVHPLAEIAPGFILPSGKKAEEVRDELGGADIVRVIGA